MWYRYPPRVSSTYIYVTNSSNNDSIARPTVGLKQRELVLLWARSKATPCTPPLWLPWFMVYQSSSPIQGPGFRKLAGSVGGGILLQVSWGCHELTETDIQCGHRYLPGPPLQSMIKLRPVLPRYHSSPQYPNHLPRWDDAHGSSNVAIAANHTTRRKVHRQLAAYICNRDPPYLQSTYQHVLASPAMIGYSGICMNFGHVWRACRSGCCAPKKHACAYLRRSTVIAALFCLSILSVCL